jgi:trans-2,3-dihydro-3-hydroxyanthranilate isomerase
VPAASFTLCDVFASGPLSGNQLAVLEETESLSDADLLALAKEFGFSETSLLGVPEPDGAVPVRIFTPSAEIPFAGHPILGSAAVFAWGESRTRVVIRCGAEAVETTLEWRGDNGAFASMVQPCPTIEHYPDPDALFDALEIARFCRCHSTTTAWPMSTWLWPTRPLLRRFGRTIGPWLN